MSLFTFRAGISLRLTLVFLFCCLCLLCQDRADGLQWLPSTAIGQQPVMADTHQPFWQEMHQEPPDKLSTLKFHDLRLVIPIVGVAEVHLIIFYSDDALITDGDSMTVARQVTNDVFCVAHAGLAIDIPRFFHERIEHGVDFTDISPSWQPATQCT